jgi:hypothetical protein
MNEVIQAGGVSPGIRRRRWPSELAATVLLLASVAGTLALTAYQVGQLTAGTGGDLSIALLAPAILAYAGLGSLILRRRPGHRVGWVLLLTAPAMLLVFAGFSLAGTVTAARGTDDLLAGIVSWIPIVLFAPAFLLAFPVLALLFPDGHLPGPRWRWPVGAILALVGLATLLLAFAPGQVDPTLAANPFSVLFVPPEARVAAALLLGPLILVGSLLGIAAMAVRFRRGRGEERQQLKWMLAAIIAVVVFIAPSLVGVDSDVLSIAASLALVLIPAAVTMAILRYHLYDIDRIISRTVSWALITGALLVVFAAALLLLQAMLTGLTQGQTIAVASSTLVAFAVFQPVRRRVQAAVDRRFDRTGYDQERVVAAFSESLRHEVDLETLSTQIRRAASDTVRPASTAVWLRIARDRPGTSGP